MPERSEPKRPIKIRRLWQRNPRTRVKESAKRYARQKMRRETRRILREEKKP